jgi:hypothetical protein
MCKDEKIFLRYLVSIYYPASRMCYPLSRICYPTAYSPNPPKQLQVLDPDQGDVPQRV